MIMRQPQQSGAFQVHGISRQETEDVHRRNCYCKKRDESENVTHVCKIREELRRFCIKLKLGKRHVKYDDEK